MASFCSLPVVTFNQYGTNEMPPLESLRLSETTFNFNTLEEVMRWLSLNENITEDAFIDLINYVNEKNWGFDLKVTPEYLKVKDLLFFASMKGFERAVFLLLGNPKTELGFYSIYENEYYTPFGIAAKMGSVAIVDMFLKARSALKQKWFIRQMHTFAHEDDKVLI